MFSFPFFDNVLLYEVHIESQIKNQDSIAPPSWGFRSSQLRAWRMLFDLIWIQAVFPTGFLASHRFRVVVCGHFVTVASGCRNAVPPPPPPVSFLFEKVTPAMFQCAKRCLESKSFDCHSFSYSGTEQNCLLSSKDRSEGVTLMKVDGTDFYELLRPDGASRKPLFGFFIKNLSDTLLCRVYKPKASRFFH